MKPVDQTIFHGDGVKGDCFRACVASVLDLSIEDVPHFFEKKPETIEDHFYFKINNWLKEKGLNFCYIEMDYGSIECDIIDKYDINYIAIGRTKRFLGRILHAVVYKNGKLLHDPHPDRSGIKKIERIGFFISKIQKNIFIQGNAKQHAEVINT